MVPLRQETVTLKNVSPGYLPRLKDNSNYGGVGSISTTVDYVNVPRTRPSFLRSFSPGWLPVASLAARPERLSLASASSPVCSRTGCEKRRAAFIDEAAPGLSARD